MQKLKILNVVGARPNFMKMAALMEAYKSRPEIDAVLVHTGQHYSERMSRIFLEQLEIPQPDINLGVGSSLSHAAQTAEIMKRFEPVIFDIRPAVVVVVGDVNSTLACALVAAKLGIKVAHVEAGLRSFDRTMPEEINRVLTDALSDYLFVSERSGLKNLKREGIPGGKVFFVGNVMIDTLLRFADRAEESPVLGELGLEKGRFVLVTLHRPSNVDTPEVLGGILKVLRRISVDLPVVFPVHPRTRKRMDEMGLMRTDGHRIRLTEPLGYLEFLKLMACSKVVLTDSGGVQEETTILRVPCLTLRENTERPVTVEVGTNRVVGTDPARILKGFQEMMKGTNGLDAAPDLWDGKAAERIAEILVRSAKDQTSQPGDPNIIRS